MKDWGVPAGLCHRPALPNAIGGRVQRPSSPQTVLMTSELDHIELTLLGS